METLHSQNSIVLKAGTVGEVVEALKSLGASTTIQAQASTSFLVKLPVGTVIRKIENGYQVGHSVLREMPSLSLNIIGKVNKGVTGALAANDERFTLAA